MKIARVVCGMAVILMLTACTQTVPPATQESSSSALIPSSPSLSYSSAISSVPRVFARTGEWKTFTRMQSDLSPLDFAVEYPAGWVAFEDTGDGVIYVRPTEASPTGMLIDYCADHCGTSGCSESSIQALPGIPDRYQGCPWNPEGSEDVIIPVLVGRSTMYVTLEGSWRTRIDEFVEVIDSLRPL